MRRHRADFRLATRCVDPSKMSAIMLPLDILPSGQQGDFSAALGEYDKPIFELLLSNSRILQNRCGQWLLPSKSSTGTLQGHRADQRRDHLKEPPCSLMHGAHSNPSRT